MSELIIKITLTFLFSLSLFGWGIIFLNIMGSKYNYMPFYTMTIGMALVIFFGGFLNMIKLAFPVSLHIISILGIISSVLFGIFTIKIDTFTKKTVTPTTIILSINYLIVFIILLFLLSTLVPSSTYNIGDDLKKYIPRLVRMLQTGTLSGNPFGSVGMDSLGAHDFLNAFIINISKIENLAAFDSVFCLFLSMLLLFDVRKSFMINASFMVILILTLLLINPQSVNISSLYSGTLMIVALIISFSELSKVIYNQNTKIKLHHIAPAAIIAAAIGSLKFTFLPFLFTYILVYFMFAFKKMNMKYIKRVYILAAFIILLMFFISPWIITHFNNYSIALSHKSTSPQVIRNYSEILYGTSFTDIKNNILICFSPSILLYGGTGLSYTLCSIIMLFFAFHLIRKSNKEEPDNIFFSLCTVCLACSSIYFLYPFIVPSEYGIRYIAPVIIAVFPIVTAIISKSYISFFTRKCNNIVSPYIVFFIFVCFLIPFIFLITDFSKVMCKRINRMYTHHTNLSFPAGTSDRWKTFKNSIFSEKSKSYFRHIQNLTEKDTTILTWISAPFHVDYTRNKIFSIGMPLGLKAPWVNLPIGTDAKTLKKFLIKKQIRYVMWEYNKSGMTSRNEFYTWTFSPYVMSRTIGQVGIFLHKTLEKIAVDSNVLYNNGHIVLFQIMD